MKLTVEGLRTSGNKVRVQHKRVFKNTPNILTRGQYEDAVKSGLIGLYSDSVSPNGGETVVQITTSDGRELEGVAKCSIKDPYNRRKGVLIALGRALNGVKS